MVCNDIPFDFTILICPGARLDIEQPAMDIPDISRISAIAADDVVNEGESGKGESHSERGHAESTLNGAA